MIRKGLLLITFFIGILGNETVIASEYSIPEIRVEVFISEKGIVEIHEHRTYLFDGTYSWADYRIPKRGFSEIKNIRVAENDEQFINNNSEQPGTFSVSERNNSVQIKWHYSASDERRTYTVSYELTDAISYGPQWSEFFWNFLAAGREKSTQNFEAEISFPKSILPDSLYAWHRGNIPVEFHKYPGTLLAFSEDIPRRESIRIRTLFPTSIFATDDISEYDQNLILESIIEEEEQYRQDKIQQAERDAFYASITREITLLIALLSIAIFIAIYRKYGSRYHTKTLSDRETVVIPGNEKPAIVGRLLNHSTTTYQHLSATIFDLARRGWFLIYEEKVKDNSDSKFRIEINKKESEEVKKLSPWEESLLRFIKQRIDKGENRFDKLFSGTDSKITTWYAGWNKLIKKQYQNMNWVDKESYRGVIYNTVAQLFLISAAIFMLVMGTTFAVLGIITTGLMLLLSFVIVRRTKEGEEVFRRWSAYRDGLKNANKKNLRMDKSDRHFIYATAFGLSEKQISNVIVQLDSDSSAFLPWLLFLPGSTHSPASIATKTSALAASGSSSFSGSIGGGGGASVGVAGGGASGGAG